MENPQSALCPLPSSLLLQGRRGFSHSSSELSSSEGVWLVRKGGEVREHERKYKKRENSRSEFYYCQKSLPPPPPPPVQDLFGAYIVLNYKQKYKNILNTHLYMKGKMVKCKNVGQPEVKRGQNQNAGSIFAACQISCRLQFPCIFCSSFPLVSDLQY